MKEYILALDQGTTSSRAVLFNRRGNIVGLAQNEFPQHYPQPGWVEHDPMDILKSQFLAVSQVLQESGVSPGQVAALGITNQRETTLVWDRTTGEPIFNAIVWQCRRTAPLCDQLIAQGKGRLIEERTGLLPDAYFSGTKIRWILDQVPGARERAQRGELLFGTVDSWLIWNLTGGHVHATDYTNACRTMLFDIDKLCWDQELLDLLDIPAAMLPQVCPSSHLFGHVSRHAPFGMDALTGIPIAGAAGDQHAALFGQACFSPGQAKNTYGTGCFLLMNTGKKRIRSSHGLLSTIAWGTEEGVEYALEGSVFNAGSVIKWLRDDLRLIATSRECDVLAESVPDTNGVYFVPAFTGLGAPHWDMYARGTILGLTRGANRAHIARSVLESIAYQVADVLTCMTGDAGIALTELRVDGGASVSDIMMQFQSDLLRIPVNRPRNIETTALGAAFLAGLAVGFWQDKSDLQAAWESERIFTPAMDERKMQELYTKWKRAVERAKGWEEGK